MTKNRVLVSMFIRPPLPPPSATEHPSRVHRAPRPRPLPPPAAPALATQRGRHGGRRGLGCGGGGDAGGRAAPRGDTRRVRRARGQEWLPQAARAERTGLAHSSPPPSTLSLPHPSPRQAAGELLRGAPRPARAPAHLAQHPHALRPPGRPPRGGGLLRLPRLRPAGRRAQAVAAQRGEGSGRGRGTSGGPP